jgi:hypothetical protein
LPNEPDICVGTGTVQTAMRPIANRFITALCDASRVDSLPLKIEENFPFRGGTFTQWVNKFFGQTVCSIQIEFNKSILMSGDRLNITHAALLKTILDTAHQQTIASFNVY